MSTGTLNEKYEKELKQETLEQKLEKLEKNIIKELNWGFKENLDLVRKLEKFKTILSVEDFKNDIKQNIELNEVEEKKLEILYSKIKEFLKLSEEFKNSREKFIIEINKDSILNSTNLTKEDFVLWKHISDSFLNKINNPKNIFEQLTWFSFWALDTIIVSLKLILDILYWIIKFIPQLKNKKYDWFKKI